MENVKTATGKEFSCDYFNASEQLGRLSMRVQGISLVEAATVFENPDETKTLTFGSQIVLGFSKLLYIAPDGDSVRVTLRKEFQ